MKYLLYFIIATFILTSTTKGQATSQPQDTVKRISLADIREFNSWAAKNISYEEYNKLTVEGTLQQLWIWSEKKRLTTKTSK